jgi:hypothetical protein
VAAERARRRLRAHRAHALAREAKRDGVVTRKLVRRSVLAGGAPAAGVARMLVLVKLPLFV